MPKNTRKEVKHFCYQCANAYDPHEIGYDGKPFLCKCPFHKWSRFLYRDGCVDNFKPKK